MFCMAIRPSISTESPHSLGSWGHSGLGAIRYPESERICVTPLIAVVITRTWQSGGRRFAGGGGEGATWLGGGATWLRGTRAPCPPPPSYAPAGSLGHLGNWGHWGHWVMRS